MAAGVLYIVVGLLPNPAFGDQPLSPGYYLFVLVGVLASLLLLGALVGLHILHANVYGWLGTAGFLLVFISTLILAVLGPVEMTAGDTASVLHSLLGVTVLVRFGRAIALGRRHCARQGVGATLGGIAPGDPLGPSPGLVLATSTDLPIGARPGHLYMDPDGHAAGAGRARVGATGLRTLVGNERGRRASPRHCEVSGSRV